MAKLLNDFINFFNINKFCGELHIICNLIILHLPLVTVNNVKFVPEIFEVHVHSN